MNNVKNVAIVLLTCIVVGLASFINVDVTNNIGENDAELIQYAKELALVGETEPITNMKVHLTTDREYAVVTFNQSGEEWVVNVEFREDVAY